MNAQDRIHRRLIGLVGVGPAQILLGLGLVVVLLGMTACRSETTSEKPSATTASAPSRVEREGQRLYNYYCVLCHGATGNGDGFNAYNLDPRPKPFSENTFITNASDADMVSVIRNGGRSVGKSVVMPPWGGTLTNEEIEAIVIYVRRLAESPASNRSDGAADASP